MNAVDAALGVVLAGSVLDAFRRGLLREASIYLGLAAAVYVAGRYTVPVLRWLELAEGEPGMALVAYLVLLVGVLVVVGVLTAPLRALTRLPVLWLADRAGGAVVGLVRGLLLGALLLTAALQLSATLVAPHLAHSRLAPVAIQVLSAVLELLPREVLSGGP